MRWMYLAIVSWRELSLRSEARAAQGPRPDHHGPLRSLVSDDAVPPRGKHDAGAADGAAVDRGAHHPALAQDDVRTGDGDVERLREPIAQRPELRAGDVHPAPRPVAAPHEGTH